MARVRFLQRLPTFLLATVVRYVLRKELLQDVRGLRKELRKEELT